MSTGPLGTYFCEIVLKNTFFSVMKIQLKMSAKSDENDTLKPLRLSGVDMHQCHHW